MAMNKSERKAYSYLKKRGHENIVFRPHKTPDFVTKNGQYEVKRGYVMKLGDIKILFNKNQRKKIIETKGCVIVFTDKYEEPVDILEYKELTERKVRKIILHDIEDGIGDKIQQTVRFEKDTIQKIDVLINKKKFDSRPQIIRRAVNDFLEQQEREIVA